MSTQPDVRVATIAAAAGMGDLSSRDNWYTAWALRLSMTDALVLSVAALSAFGLRFGLQDRAVAGGPAALSYSTLGCLLVLGWLAFLELFKSRERHVLGNGVDEFRRVVAATVTTFGVFSIVSLALRMDASRGYLLVAFPLGLALLMIQRSAWRRRLRAVRAGGQASAGVLLVGGLEPGLEIGRWLRRHPSAGLRVVGVWTPDSPTVDLETASIGPDLVPVLGGLCPLREALASTGAQAVIVTDSEHLGHGGLKDLAWDLEDAGIGLMVSPNVIDTVSSRMRLFDVASMPLLAVDEPRYGAAISWRKTTFDRLGALGLVLAFLPVMLVTAAAVKLTSVGPVFYRQERVGLNGRPFDMLKFRSMVVDADRQRADLLGTGPLAKLEADPRVTPTGRFIRRYSLDELPQLINVIRGDMSLVGPRPQRDFEVAAYDNRAHRRLRVRPGMTGLWQVSGRSDVSWEESLRLDTFYVENWSMTGDLMILFKTLAAVVAGDGAY